jgi:hypothetical protein
MGVLECVKRQTRAFKSSSVGRKVECPQFFFERTGSLRGSTPQNQRRSDFLAIPFLCGHQLTAYLTAEGTRSGHTVQVENNFDGIVVVLNDTGHVLCPNPFSLT